MTASGSDAGSSTSTPRAARAPSVVVVVGAGEAGLLAASKLLSSGIDVVLVEQKAGLGGVPGAHPAARRLGPRALRGCGAH